MGSINETNPSLWIGTTTDAPDLPSLGESERFDVVVVGAGITGLTTARLLAADGCSVGVIEAGALAAGATGYTTAKFTALQRTAISEIAASLGDERAGVYAAANAAAVERAARLVADDGIDCGFERAAACTYTTQPDQIDAIEAEHGAATRAGLTTRLDTSTELPLEVVAAVWLDDQAQLHPRRYCLGLASAIAAAGGAIFQHTRAVDVAEADGSCTVTVAGGAQVTADHVVLASHLPFLNTGAYFARAHPYRSYALAARLRTERVRGMYISKESPTRSVRSTADGWTVIGGEGHKVGQDEDTVRRYRALDDWATETFDLLEIGFRWSAQDYQTVDGMPYIGRLTKAHPQVWAATGFRKWGMSNGTVAAMIISDLIAGRHNPWAEAFDSTRVAPRASIKSLVTRNLDVGRRAIADRLRTRHPDPVDRLGQGEGDIAEMDGEAVAAFRDEDGGLHAVAPRCTHLGCRVTFNTAERSWDCPCHGSRFDVDGHVLQGPAVDDLPPKPTR